MRQEELKLVISAVDQATAAIQGVGQSIGWLGGAVTKAAIQFNAITQAAQMAGQAMKAVFKEVTDAVEGFNMAVIQSAAMITGMMEKDSRPLAERYKEAKTYAHQLQLVLEQIDKETLLTARDLGNITAEMQKQGVLLDVTNAKQIEAFKSLSNAVAVVSQGYPAKEVQIRQEIRSLLSGQTRATDTLSGMLKAQVGDLESQIALHKQQGDLIEWLGEQLQGFAAASGDIENTWEAVKTSMQTIYRQVLRGALSEPFQELVGLLKQMSEWFTEHKEQIQEGLGRAWAVIKSLVVSTWELFKALAPLLQPVLVIAQALVTAFEDIALRVIPGMVRAIADTFGKVKEFYEWLKSKTTGGEEGGDILTGTDRSQRAEHTDADFQNTQRGLTVAPPRTKTPPNEELQKKLDDWKKLKESLLTMLAKSQAESEWEKKLAEIEGKYRQITEDPKWKGVPGVNSFMNQWREGMLQDAEKDFDKKSYANAVKIAGQVEKELSEQAIASLQSLRESSEEYYRDETEMANRRYQRAQISEKEMVDAQLEAAQTRMDAEIEYQDAVEIRYRRGEIAWEKYNQLIRQSDRELQKVKKSVEELTYQSDELGKGFEGGWMKGWERYGQDLNNLYQRGVDAAQQTARGMEGAFKSLFFDAMRLNFKSLGDLLMNFMNRLLDVMANQLAEFWAKALMGGIGGGGGLGDLLKLGGSALMGYLGMGGAGFSGQGNIGGGVYVLESGAAVNFPGRASGGTVTAQRPYWVGEMGPEIFVPGNSGTIVPNHAAAGMGGLAGIGGTGGGVTVINISAVDSKSFEDMCRRNPSAIVDPVTRSLRMNQTRSEWNDYLGR
jgi:lambda family phage tail tape measure protein